MTDHSKHASCCVEDIIKNCLAPMSGNQFTIAFDRYGNWDDKEVTENRLGLDVYSETENVNDNEFFVGNCGTEEVSASLLTTFEIWACRCEGSRLFAKSGLADIQKTLFDCWKNPELSNMRWDSFAYLGYTIDGQNDAAQVTGDFTVLIAQFQSNYRYSLCRPDKILARKNNV